MTNLARVFLSMALSGEPVESRPLPVKDVPLKYCECAGMQTPHMQKEDHLECAWCGNKVYGTQPAS